MCPIVPVTALDFGPTGLDMAGLSVVILLYGISVARNAFAGSSFALAQRKA